MRTRIALTALAAAALALATVPGIAVAGKGGNGNGGNGNGGGDTTPSTAWVSASPNPASAGGARVYLSGCGYSPDSGIQVRIKHSAGYTESFMVGMWYTGCMDNAYFLTREAGSYTIEVWQANSKSMSMKAWTPLGVG